ncbi:transcriptional regulator [Streptomyces albireticuli]|uniref:transcriptional regulator n=1 Tax=Streptomyces albireticuli TaxID=1940 RepID=UPI001E36B087|nr:helix-turn-helix transcriptional regulator [Streptomyces albireticuli]MCD9143904.1 helix-turn-helix domain-containing protein [Streptomyces albireticuli]MCD9161665.1 helix-turn-helix domain-containing protein [Streptomyces albireticuli]MCD9192021.1 helix-turn-helix domain-containing protein [Streptomyces albireticuli]
MGASDLADLLRALKDRSGLSYGVLAKRLHVSTSTLHRYCNGSTVPAEFAPLERLARLCKATPEEMMRLHRTWIVADATRGRKAEADGASDGGTPDRGARAGAAAAGTTNPEPAASAAGTTGGAQPSPVTPAAGTTAAPQPSPVTPPEEATSSLRAGAATPPEATTASPTPGTTPPPEDVTTPPPATAAPPVDRPQRARRRPRKAVLAALAVACVMAVTGSAALAVGLVGHDGDDGKRASAGASSTGKGGTAAPGRPGRPGEGPAGTPSASPEEGKEREGGESAASTGPGDAASPGAPGAPGERENGDGKDKDKDKGDDKGGDKAGGDGGDPPLTAHTRPYAYESPCSQRFLVNRAPGEMPKPPFEQDAPAWVSELGAVTADQQFIKITLQGAGKDTVVLEQLHVRVDGTNAPLAWNAYATGVGCGGDVATRAFGVDLDAGSPALRPVAGQRDFPYKVSRDDPEVFYVKADAKRSDVRWHLELQWSSGGRRGILRIDDQGRPFRTSGSAGRPSFQQPPGDTKWGPEPPQE